MFPTACAKVTKAQGQSGCKVLVAGQASHIEVLLSGSVKPRLQGFPKVLVGPDGIRLSRVGRRLVSLGKLASSRLTKRWDTWGPGSCLQILPCPEAQQLGYKLRM